MEEITEPGYWMYEQSGVLGPAVARYFGYEPLSAGDIGALRAYLRQWITLGAWKGEGLEELRASVETISSRADIDRWTAQAAKLDIDPW